MKSFPPPARHPLRRLAGHLGLGALCGLAGCFGLEREHPIELPGPGVAVYAAGDIADCGDRPAMDSGAARTAALVAERLAQEPDARVLALGDNSYPAGRLAEFEACYGPTWGRFKARTLPTPGNHEHQTPGAAGYYAYFGEVAGERGRGYYSRSIGSWQLIALNSALSGEDLQAQLAWLKSELSARRARCTLAYWHHPLYSSGRHGSQASMREAWQLLADAGAELVLSAHDHHYERFAPQDAQGRRDELRGLRQFVVGTGGAPLRSLRLFRSHSESYDSSSLGVLRLVLKDAGYEWEFLPVQGGRFSDRGAAACR